MERWAFLILSLQKGRSIKKKYSENVDQNQTILCACRLSRESISNISGKVEDMKLKLSEHVKGVGLNQETLCTFRLSKRAYLQYLKMAKLVEIFGNADGTLN